MTLRLGRIVPLAFGGHYTRALNLGWEQAWTVGLGKSVPLSQAAHLENETDRPDHVGHSEE